jgi:precorrin-6A synthase
MRSVLIIGIGAGDPDYLTVQAIKALNLVDVFFFVDKGQEKQDLINLRYQILERYVERSSYIQSVTGPHRHIGAPSKIGAPSEQTSSRR